jgi:two-component system NarL family sensor kinase
MLEETAEELNEVVIEVRGIAHGLYPESLIDLGLEAALRQLALDMTPPPSPIDFTVAGETGDLPDASNLALYRVAQEALTNIKRHAGAQRISMQLKSDHSHVTLTICDDGAGFDPAKCKNSPGAGIGLRNMKRRLEAETVDGELTIMSSQRGTRVVAKVPRTPRNDLLIDLWPLNRK